MAGAAIVFFFMNRIGRILRPRAGMPRCERTARHPQIRTPVLLFDQFDPAVLGPTFLGVIGGNGRE
jgi:hypothetical protein